MLRLNDGPSEMITLQSSHLRSELSRPGPKSHEGATLGEPEGHGTWYCAGLGEPPRKTQVILQPSSRLLHLALPSSFPGASGEGEDGFAWSTGVGTW